MKKFICTVLASIVTASAAVPFFSSAADPSEDYIPDIYFKSRDTECSEVIGNGSVYINTSAIQNESTKIPFSVFIKDDSKSLWDIRVKLKTNCPDMVFRDPRLPSDDGQANAYDNAALKYDYLSSCMDDDQTNGKKRNYMSVSLYIFNDVENRLIPTGEQTDEYPMTIFDMLVNKSASLGSYKVYSISEPEPETEIFTDEPQTSTTSFRYLNKDSRTVVPNSLDKKVIISDRTLGDVDNDHTIDSADASKILEAYSDIINGKEHSLGEGGYLAADINGDSEVDSSDASLVLSYYSYIMNGNTNSISAFLRNN